MSQEDGTNGSLDLVEARVHLAAAQYHNSLANGKLIPRPPSAPRSRPASAGAVRPAQARPWSAQSVHGCPANGVTLRAELLEAQRMDSATDALAVLLGPWGNCCYQAPPGVITTTLHDIADMLRISATRRERRKNFIMSSRQKFLPRSPESLERLHASIIGRALGRSFANVLLLTKVLMAFREAMHTSELHGKLSRRTRWLQAEKSQIDERCLEHHFYAWLHHSTQSSQCRAAEAEILRGREALVQVYSQGREDVAKVVDRLYAQQMEQLLFLCLSSWRDAMRLLSLEGYGYHLASIRQRTPQMVDGLFLSQVKEACLLVCLICWACSVALERQGRVLKETDAHLQELQDFSEHQGQQLQQCHARKDHLSCSSRAFVGRSIQRAERQLLEVAWHQWWQLNQALRCREQRLLSLQQRIHRRALRLAHQGWLSAVWESRRKSHAMRQGLRAVARWEEQQRSVILSEWTRVMRERKAEDLLRWKGQRRLILAERRFRACSTQRMSWVWNAWRGQLLAAAERAQQIQRFVALGEERLQHQQDATALRILGAWHLSTVEGRYQMQRQQAQLQQQRAMGEALSHAELALQRCQEPGSFHCRLLCEWRLLVVQRKTREAQRRSSVKMVASKEAYLEEALLSACLRFWRGTTQLGASQRAKAQALRNAQQEMHLKTLNALRRRQESEDDALQQLHFSAWHQHLLNSKILKVEKEETMTKLFGQLVLEDEMLRSRSFYQWRDALHHARHDAMHEAKAREEEERKKEAYEQKLQVMREAFQNSSEALLSSALLSWHSVTQRGKQHSAAFAQRERLHDQWTSDFARFLSLHCFTTWRCHSAVLSLRRRKRAAAVRLGQQMLDVWQLRQVQGLTSIQSRAFQAQLLELWRQAALLEQRLRHARRKQRRWQLRVVEEKMLPALDVSLCAVVLQQWQQLRLAAALGHRLASARELQRARAARWLSRQQLLSLQRLLWDLWRLQTSERRSQQRVAASCQNTREVRLHVRDRMLQSMERLLEELDRDALDLLLLRWHNWSQSVRRQRRMKENGYKASSRFAEDHLVQWCTWTFFTWAAEARQSRHDRVSEHLDRQVSGARVVQSQMTQGWRKAVLALSREQQQSAQCQLRHALCGWSCRTDWKKHCQRRLCTLLCRARCARDLRRWMWRWQAVLLQEKSANRVERSRTHAETFICQLRSLWLLQQTFSSWQHARAYEELFRILSDTQADLARAAEATALAETAAVAAQQRTQRGVTVRVLPSPSNTGWSEMAPRPPVNTHTVSVEEDAPSHHFQAPVVSLQKDIQRHYAQRIQDLQTRGSRTRPPCSFEVNITQPGAAGGAAPRREAWCLP